MATALLTMTSAHPNSGTHSLRHLAIPKLPSSFLRSPHVGYSRVLLQAHGPGTPRHSATCPAATPRSTVVAGPRRTPTALNATNQSQARADVSTPAAPPTTTQLEASTPATGELTPSAAGISQRQTPKKKDRPVLVVLGSGWGGMSFVNSVNTSAYDVVMVSPRNYFLYTPLLPSVTTGLVEARSVAEPIRRIMRNKQFTFVEAECVDIDPTTKTLRCQPAADEAQPDTHLPTVNVAYDHLILAVGARPNTFGVPGVQEHCFFLKELGDALKIRRRVLDSFEAASLPGVPEEERKRLLSFVVVGGGPTGVEFSAELFDLVHEDLVRLYPTLVPLCSVTIVEAMDHILNMFDQRISEFAQRKFQRQGVTVLTGQRVVQVHRGSITLADRATGLQSSIPCGTALWSTGIGTRPLLLQFMAKVGQQDRRAVATDEWLRVLGCRDVWAIGDCGTVMQRPLADDVVPLFNLADTNKDGCLTPKELEGVLRSVKTRYPQVSVSLRRGAIQKLISESASVSGENGGSESGSENGGCLRIPEFEEALRKVDTQLKAFPATAQVAAQQGEYLARCFNSALDPGFKAQGPPRTREPGMHRFKPFRYIHLGQFAPLGSGKAGVQLPGDIISVGTSTQWLWYSVYAVKQVSWRTRVLVLFDWAKGAIFGRDTSKI